MTCYLLHFGLLFVTRL